MLNYIDFLKKYSTVPIQFIEDFYKISDYKEINNNEMTINLNDVVKWLVIQKHGAKKTLKKSYIKDVDYKIIKNNKTKGSGGHNKETILLTINCFKKFCQLTKSIKGNVSGRIHFVHLLNLAIQIFRFSISSKNACEIFIFLCSKLVLMYTDLLLIFSVTSTG